MERIEDEMLMRLADGELPDAAAEALLRRIETDADLAARFALFTETRRTLADSFAPILAAKVPDRLVAAVLAADAATRPANDRGSPAWARRPMRRPLVAACLAALLAAPLGYLAGRTAPTAMRADPLMAAPAVLVAALETTPSGTMRRDGDVAVQPFATHLVAGGACRDFMLREGSAATLGVACRAAEGWQVRAAVRVSTEDRLRPASADHPALAAILAGLGAAAPLDAESEAALIGRGWR
jgi:hypothetical protein